MKGIERSAARAILALALTLAGCAHDTPQPEPVAQPTPTSEREPNGASVHATDTPSGSTTGTDAPHVGDTRSDETACSGERSCVLVSVGCGAVTAVARDHAREAAERYDRIASVAECGPMRAPDAVEPVCTTNGCSTQPVPNPGVRRCLRDSDCVPIDWGCHWTPVARRDEALARQLMPVGPGCPGIMPAPPDTACIGTFCTFAWNVVR